LVLCLFRPPGGVSLRSFRMRIFYFVGIIVISNPIVILRFKPRILRSKVARLSFFQRPFPAGEVLVLIFSQLLGLRP
jgi:hypothetical protein